MKPSAISVALLVVSLLSAPALLAQSPDSANQTTVSPAASAAEVPRLIKFSGALLDAQDRPMAGPVGVTFALHAQQTGGAALWMETQNVTPDAHGFYTVLLGANSTNGVPAELFASGEARWLEVQVERQAEQPRVLLVSVPYALKAGDAQTLGGKPASAYALAGAGMSLVTSTTGTSEAPVAATGGTPLAPSTSGPQPLTVTPCASVTSDGAAAVGSLAKLTTACNIEGSGISENGSGQVGIGGAPSTTAKLFLTDSPTLFNTARWLQQGLFITNVTANSTNTALTFDMDMTNMLISPGVTDSGSRIAFRSLSYANNTGFKGTLNQQIGILAQAGIRSATSGAVVNSAYGGLFTILNQVAGTTINNAYGVWIKNSDTVGTITNRYDLYASSPNANSFFAGKVGIGTTTPLANLEVNGTTKFDAAVTFAGGQTFPGTGTITAVNTPVGSGLMGGAASGAANLSLISTCTVGQVLQWNGVASWVCASVGGAGTVTSVGSGLGLTGGPITTSGTLAINPAVVPQLGVVNTFNNSQNIVGNLTVSGTANVIALGGTFDGPNGGVFGRDTINDGANRIGVQGAAASTGGAGVVGTSTAATGQAAGVRGFAASSGGAGVYGQATLATGVTAGVRGVASSPSGRGVSGDMVAATPNTAIAGGSGVAGTYGFNQDGSINASATGGFGVFGQNTAPDGTGVYGTVSSTADNANDNGVRGVTASPVGIGVNGLAQDTTGGTTMALTSVGVQGQSNSPAGIGVNAFDLYQCLLPGCDPSVAAGPAPVGLKARVLHANGVAVLGIAGSATVGCAMPTCDPTKTGNVGVVGRSFHPNGIGTVGVARDSSVTNTAGGIFSVGVLGQAASPTSYALYAHFVPATVGVGAAALFNNNAGFTAVPPTTLCIGAATCNVLIAQANGTNVFRVSGDGHAHATAFDLGGADFAESVSVRGGRQLYDAGDVMVIDDAGNRSLAKSRRPYSTLVAGIVSTKPGVLASLHNSTTSAGQKAIEAEVPLAVVGIVPCKVSAENGPIHAGDLLVTSSTAGYAMKGTDRARMLGAVVGKALQPMQTGKGVIEVLVTLQ